MTNNSGILQAALNSFAGIDEDAFNLARHLWKEKTYKKGEFYHEYKSVYKYLGFIIKGVFRSYYIHPETMEERNMFFYTDQQIVVSYRSRVEQTSGNYYTEAMTDTTIIYIRVDHLQELYRHSHQWEKFGRLVAERAFVTAISKAESMLFSSPEERYLDLMHQHPALLQHISLQHIASYLGIRGPSLSRIRKRIVKKTGNAYKPKNSPSLSYNY
jgi:CRP-like cAMP-binding protein